MFIVVMGMIILSVIFLQSYAYRKYWDKDLTALFRFSGKEAFEGDKLYLRAEIANKKILPLPWLMVEYQLSSDLIFSGGSAFETGESMKVGVFSVMAYKRVRRKLPFTCGKRGVYRLRRVRLLGSNLLHTQTYHKYLNCPNELTVFPGLLTEFEGLSVIINNVDVMLTVRALINPDPFTFRGIREYAPVDPLRNINFKATAVARELMVNIHAPTSSKQLEIILNMEHCSIHSSEELYEQAIRLAATFAHHYLNEDVSVGFYTNGRDVVAGKNTYIPRGTQTAQLYAIYRALARLGLAFRPNSISAYLDTLDDKGSVYVIISTYHGADFISAVEGMAARGLAVQAVIPVKNDAEIILAESTEIKIWRNL
ncbi:MAG: DUF58 domain-containing protein [Defluviitaleaceae bacterium]|nr:DUF58 domain-containing protein [Defluviitaleaceae bacterium]